MTDFEPIHVLDKKVKLLQPEKGFRTSLDSVMLAAACPAQGSEKILDMGCGVGGVAFCIFQRVPKARITGIDVQKEYIELAEKNRAINGPALEVNFMCCDIRQVHIPAEEQRFDHIVCNPPYMEGGAHTPSPDEGKAAAKGHSEADDMSLQEWIDGGFGLLKSKGSFTIIHRADMTDKIIRFMGKKFGAYEIFPLWPKAGQDAKRVIIRAIKDRRSPARIHAGIVLHNADGSYTAEADKILRDGAPLL